MFQWSWASIQTRCDDRFARSAVAATAAILSLALFAWCMKAGYKGISLN